MRARLRTIGGSLLLVAALTACGDDPERPVAGEAVAGEAVAGEAVAGEAVAGEAVTDGSTASASASPSQVGGDGGPASAPDDEPSAEATQPPVDEPPAAPTTAPATGSPTGGPDLDGDGRADQVSLVAVPDMGWSFDVRLADGRETSAPLPDDDVVREDVELLGPVDLDRDGAEEVLVRTLRAVGGENAVVFRLDGDGVWLVRHLEGAPFELSTSGGMTGPRSWACADGEVLTRESERQPDGTYRATTWRWTLDGHVAGPSGAARDDALAADDVSLDPSTCDA